MPNADVNSLLTDKNLNLLASRCFATLDYHQIECTYSPLHPKEWAAMLLDGEHPDFDTLFFIRWCFQRVQSG